MRDELLLTIPEDLGRVLEAIARIGGRPVLVGGAVRDAVLGVPVGDFDVECYSVTYTQIVDALRELGHVDIVGRAFGVVKFRSGSLEVDLSMPRRDSKSGNRHQDFSIEIDHTMTFADAASRRDFTVNAMGWEPFEDRLLDPYLGRADLESGTLRHVSDAFSDDPLRVLRGVQLAGRFAMRLAPETAQLCRSIAHEFRHLPTERVWGEWEKIATKARRPGMSLDALRASGWMQHHPELTAIEGVPQEPTWHPEGPVEVHTAEAMDAAAHWCDERSVGGADRMIAVLGALVHDFGKATHTQIHEDGRVTSYGHAAAGVGPARSFLRSIGAPSHVTAVLLPIVREHMCVACAPEQVTPAAVRRLARRLSPATMEQWASVVEADHLGRGTASHAGITDRWMQLARDSSVEQRALPPILRGEMLMSLGLTPGKEFGRIIEASKAAQDDGVIFDDRSAVVWARLFLGMTPST